MSVGSLAGITPRQLDTLRNGLRIMALRALGNADAADDVVQETLLRALTAVTAEIAADSVRLGAFMGGIARHVIVDMKRRDQRFSPLHEKWSGCVDASALDEVLRDEERAAVMEALVQLPVSDQELLRACFFEGLTPSEVAVRVNSSPETVRKRKSRALERLRRIFQVSRHAEVAAPSKRVMRRTVAAESGK